ncbi:MAG TPA: methyl-accepting chemotaxis protein, partial [Verrucomicrobiae bacterium]
MKNLSLPRQLLLLLSLSVGVTLLASAVYFVTLRGVLNDSAKLTQTAMTDLTRSQDLLARLSATQSAIQNLLRQKDPDEIEKGLQQVETAAKEMQGLITACGEAGKPILQHYTQLLEGQKAVVDQLLLGNGGGAYEQFLSSYTPRYEAMLKEVEGFTTAVQNGTKDQMTAQQRRTQSNILWSFSIVGVVLVGLALIGWRLKHNIGQRLQGVAANLNLTSETLSASAGQISTASQRLAEGASEQAASLEETSASLEEMSSMTQRNAVNAQQAKELAGQARAAADTGASDMREMTAAMAEIKSASDNIAKILKTIDEIAFQTNLLALNA